MIKGEDKWAAIMKEKNGERQMWLKFGMRQNLNMGNLQINSEEA